MARGRAVSIASRRVAATAGARAFVSRPAARWTASKRSIAAPSSCLAHASFSSAIKSDVPVKVAEVGEAIGIDDEKSPALTRSSSRHSAENALKQQSQLNVKSFLNTPIGALDRQSIDEAISTLKQSRKGTNMLSTADLLLRRLIDEITCDEDGTGPSYAEEVVGVDLLHGVLQCYQLLSREAAEFSRQNRASPDKSHAQKAEDLLNYAEAASSKLGGVNMLTPGTDTYGIVIEAYAKVGDASKAEELLQRIEPKWLNETPSPKSKNDRFYPTSNLYQSVLAAWAFSRQPNSARMAESVLEKMSHLQRLGYDVRFKTIHYNLVINALAKSGEHGAAVRAEKIIDHMMRESKDSSSPGARRVTPCSRTFNTCLHAYANSKERNAAEKAEALLNRMEDLHQNGETKDCAPNRISYNNVITAWSRSGVKGAAERAEAILAHMQRIAEMDESRETSPNEISFNGVMAAWSTSNERGAAARCQALLAHMTKLCREGNKDVCPDTVSYSTTIHALAVSGEKNAAERAQALLESMEKLHKEGISRVRPNTVCYTAVLNAISKSRDPDMAKKAEVLLQRMERMANDGNISVKPNHMTYATVIDCYSKSPQKGTANKARNLLDRLKQRAQEGECDLKPNINTYTAVLDAYSREGQVADAEKLLQDMEEQGPKPTSITYNVLIKAQARKRDALAGVRAEAYIDRMKGNDVAPDRISYSSCVDAYGKSHAPNAYDNARRIFYEMIELEASGVPRMKPNKVRKMTMCRFHLRGNASEMIVLSQIRS